MEGGQNNDTRYLIGLSSSYAIGSVHLKKLMDNFSSAKEAFEASAEDIKKAGIPPKTVDKFINERRNIDMDGIMARMKEESIGMITIRDRSYPPLLREISQPPYMLFVKGRLERESLPLAVVGSRRSSAYGRQALSRILEQALRIYNLNIISGMALGIDSEAHKAALAKGAPTTAVLAGGLNKENIYPAKNASLADEIIKNNGAVISEFPPFTENFKGHFVQRNRIIAGMARGVLVIEAQERSGTLITAGYALEEGREVMAVPGPINTPYSQGTNTLIKKGAHAVTCAEDIGDIFDLTGEVKSAMNNKKEYKDENCQNIITFLKDGPQHINNIAKATGIPPKDLTPRLTSLELEGEIKNLGGMIFGIVK